MSIIIRVTKGSLSLRIRKGDTVTVCPTAHEGRGVRVGRIGAHSLWMSGNRRHVPAFKVGDVVNMHDGRPEHSVRAVVEAVTP